MSEREGVIKYRLEHRFSDLPDSIALDEINAWRNLLHRLNLIGQLADKYDGVGFGNISRRLTPGNTPFLISGTQTGHLVRLEPAHFAIVDSASPRENTIQSHGPSQPSPEALTHASVYQHDPNAQAVIHVHSEELWRHTHRLGLPHTGADVAYGSVEMAEAVEDLFASGQLQDLSLFSMLGHEDGIVAFGASMAEAGTALLSQLARAIAVEQSPAAG